MSKDFDWLELVVFCVLVALCAAFAPIVTVVVTSAYLAYMRLAGVHGVGLILPGSMAAVAMLMAIESIVR